MGGMVHWKCGGLHGALPIQQQGACVKIIYWNIPEKAFLYFLFIIIPVGKFIVGSRHQGMATMFFNVLRFSRRTVLQCNGAENTLLYTGPMDREAVKKHPLLNRDIKSG